MRYMLLEHAVRWWPTPGLTELAGRVRRQLAATGELVSAAVLRPASEGVIVQAHLAGQPSVIAVATVDGRPCLARYWVIDCEEAARALAIAAEISSAAGRAPTSVGLPIEVRPLMACWGEEM